MGQVQNGGRPPIEIDEELLEKLTKLHLSDKVIADCVGCSVDTLHRRFADKMEQWKSESKSKIAHVLFDEAIIKREPWALKALAQKHLDYSDRAEVKQEVKSEGFVVEFAQIDKVPVKKD